MTTVAAGRTDNTVAGRQYLLSFNKPQGRVWHRSIAVRDLAVILDADPFVERWMSIRSNQSKDSCSAPDLRVTTRDGAEFYADAPDRAECAGTRQLAISLSGSKIGYRFYSMSDVYGGPRLHNSRELLRYGRYQPSLADRIRLLGGLEEHGSLTLSECLAAFQERKAIPSIASLHIHGWIEIDLDSELIGPETRIRRFRV